MLILVTGILAAYIAGTYLKYTTVPYVFICLPIVFLMGFSFFPDTMQQNLKKGNHKVGRNINRNMSD